MYATRTGLPPPEPTELEELAVEILQRMFNAPLPAQRVGRAGQKQFGIDVKVRAEDGRYIGAQTKRYLTTLLTPKKLMREVEASAEIDPPLDALIIITTLPNDAKLQFAADNARLHGKHTVQVWFDQDINRHLEKYGLGFHLLTFAHEKDLAAAYEYKTGRSLTIGATTLPPESGLTHSTTEAELHDLLQAGRAREALRRLDLASSTDVRESQRQLIRTKALYAMEDNAACLAFVEGLSQAEPAVLAIAGLAAANLDDRTTAAQLQARAMASAKEEERTYVTGLGVLIAAAVDPSLSYEQLIERVPESLRTSPELASMLGDIAMVCEHFEEAVLWFERAEQRPGTASPMGALSLATAMVAMAVDRLPLGWSELRDPDDRELAERGHVQLELLRIRKLPLENASALKALLSNLAIACGLLGDRDGALMRAREALDIDLSDAEMWQRWLSMALRFDASIDIDSAAASAPLDPEVQLALARLAAAADRNELARRAFDAVLAEASASLSVRDAARYGIKRLDQPGTVSAAALEEAMDDLRTAPFSAGPFLIEQLNDSALREEAQTIAHRVAEAAATLPSNQAVAMAAILRNHGRAQSAAPLIPVLRQASQRAGRLDLSVADVLIDVLLANRRYTEADVLSKECLAQAPALMIMLAKRVSVLAARGHFELAWDLLADAVRTGRGHESVSLLEQFASLSRTLGRLREGRRLVGAQVLPETKTPRAFRGLLSALTILHDRRINDVVLAGAQGALIEPATSGSVFALAIQQRAPRPRVSANAAVTMRDVRTGEERLLWLGSREAGPHAAAPVSFDEVWIEPLRDRSVGDTVTFTQGPFAGRSFTVDLIRHPQHLLVSQAEAVAVTVGLQGGGLDTVSETNTDQLVARMRAQLEAKRDFTQKRLATTQSLGLPASVAAMTFEVSPREFLQRSPLWSPSSGPGTEATVRVQDEAIKASELRFVLDPTTLLLLITLNAEALAKALTHCFVVTPQTVAMLRQWYLLERQNLRARGSMSLGESGRLRMHEYGSSDRRMQRQFWRRVFQFVDTNCEMVELQNDDVAARGATFEAGVDTATLSAIALAGERGWALLAEETGARNLAQALGVSGVTSLQRLIAWAGEVRTVRRSDAVQWLAGLIELGWSFVVLPNWSFGAALNLSDQVRRSTLKQLFSILRTAAPEPAMSAILAFLVDAEKVGVERSVTLIDRTWLRRTALRGMPRGTESIRRVLPSFMHEIAPGRPYRSLRRAVSRWVKRK